MSNGKLGYRECYICKSAIPPLVSICWSCGYSQLPNPQGEREAPSAEDGGDEAPPAKDASGRDKLRADLDARLKQTRADLKSRLKRKSDP